MSDTGPIHRGELISEEDFNICLEEIRLVESHEPHVAGGEQGACSFMETCVHCPCIPLKSSERGPSCDVCEKQKSSNNCYKNYIRKIEIKGATELVRTKDKRGDHATVTQDKPCANCEEYKLRYENYRSYVASVRVEAEMIEAELEGIEYVKGRMSQDEACISAVNEIYSSILLRRIRLIQSFTQHLITTKPVTGLLGGVCTVHLGKLPAAKFLEDITSEDLAW